MAFPRPQRPEHDQTLSACDLQARTRPPQGGRWPGASGPRPDVETKPHDLGHSQPPKAPRFPRGLWLIAIFDQAANQA